MKLWNCVHELVWNHKNMNSKYVLTYSNWNDFGYQTGFYLYICHCQNSRKKIVT